MTLDVYQTIAVTFAQYIDKRYLRFSILEEGGELAGVFSRMYREGSKEIDLIKECGDVLWNMTLICHEFGIQISAYHNVKYPSVNRTPETIATWCYKLCGTIGDSFENDILDSRTIGVVLYYLPRVCGLPIEDIAQYNIDKLNARKAKNMITGKGDNRELE